MKDEEQDRRMQNCGRARSRSMYEVWERKELRRREADDGRRVEETRWIDGWMRDEGDASVHLDRSVGRHSVSTDEADGSVKLNRSSPGTKTGTRDRRPSGSRGGPASLATT